MQLFIWSWIEKNPSEHKDNIFKWKDWLNLFLKFKGLHKIIINLEDIKGGDICHKHKKLYPLDINSYKTIMT